MRVYYRSDREKKNGCNQGEDGMRYYPSSRQTQFNALLSLLEPTNRPPESCHILQFAYRVADENEREYGRAEKEALEERIGQNSSGRRMIPGK